MLKTAGFVFLWVVINPNECSVGSWIFSLFFGVIELRQLCKKFCLN